MASPGGPEIKLQTVRTRLDGAEVSCVRRATGKMRTCGSADVLDLKMTKPNYKPNNGPNSNPDANPNTKRTLILI